MSQRLIDITDDFEQATSNLEQQVLDRIYRAFDAALRDTRRQIREVYPRLQSLQNSGDLTLLNRQTLIAQELADYLKLLKPEQAEQMDALLSELLQQSTENGQRLAEALTKEIDPAYDMAPFVQVPLDAVIAQARTFRERLFRYSDQEASQISAVVEQGLVQGWDIRRTELQLNQLGVRFKSSAETVALTETMSAYNRGAMDRYQRSGLELVQWTVTPSERLCRYCLARNMKVYRVDEVVYPLHPRDRCALMPWFEEWQEQGLTDDAFARQYRERTLKELRAEGVEPDSGLAPFEKGKIEQPPEPVWQP